MTDTELKEKILNLIRTDKDFAFEVHRLILKLYGDDLVTKAYLEEALVKQSLDLKREFYEALGKQSEGLGKEFYYALGEQSEDLKKFVLEVKAELIEKIDETAESLIRRLMR
ncbi:MAG: hypothetical protein RMJ37_02405 [Spirochaetia bacterium]|nr:hypothetical protein [Spirochaetota bacterium]MCX8096715.1 hypothetical protein [Spirochaetota bacterium]MDW8112178.1 hypothetical protein [Spirochaetia bacterium]